MRSEGEHAENEARHTDSEGEHEENEALHTDSSPERAACVAASGGVAGLQRSMVTG